MIETSDVVRVIRDNNLAPSNSQLDPNTTLEELGIDSLNRATLFLEIEEAYGRKLSPDDEERYQTIQQLVDFVNGSD